MYIPCTMFDVDGKAIVILAPDMHSDVKPVRHHAGSCYNSYIEQLRYFVNTPPPGGTDVQADWLADYERLE